MAGVDLAASAAASSAAAPAAAARRAAGSAPRRWGGAFLWGLVAVQGLAGAYFLWTILGALLGLPELPLRWQTREVLDLAADFGLVFGAVLSVRLAWRADRAGDRAETARRLGLGQAFNIGMSAVTEGLIPNKEWKLRERGAPRDLETALEIEKTLEDTP